MAEAAVVVDGVSLCYRLARQRTHSLKEYAVHWLRGALTYSELWALRDISFEIPKGAQVALLGRNGAGKSTLLKVIATVLKPTIGRSRVQGKVVPILELGMGFDYELTGIENVYLNALFLGQRRREIDAKINEIIDFSGLGEFAETPIRNYSSGMLARLGFSIATAWKPDVLILDEVLAVGDFAFRARCRDRISELRSGGCTVLTVLHGFDETDGATERCLLLHGGRLVADGEPAAVVAQYHELLNQPGAVELSAAR
jgi:ABC-type polysaccharide/polyol phosphate transport system ATPase subunit